MLRGNNQLDTANSDTKSDTDVPTGPKQPQGGTLQDHDASLPTDHSIGS